MDANSHMMYGIIVAEIFYWLLKRNDSYVASQYNRVQLWLLGALGGFIPDMDALPGILQYLLGNDAGSLVETVKVYHRVYSHGLLFLIPFLIFSIISLVLLKREKLRTNNHKEIDLRLINPLGYDQPEFTWMNGVLLGCFIVSNLFYTDPLKYLWAFSAVTFAVLFSLSFTFKQNKAGYTFIIVFNAFFHLVLDFFRGKLEIFGPWDPNYQVGLWVYPATIAGTMRFTVFYILFEISVHIIAAVLITLAVRSYLKWNAKSTIKN